MIETLAHGTTLTWRDGRLVARHGADGAPQAELRWADDRLVAMRVAGFGPRALALDGAIVDHPVLGPAHALHVDATPCAHLSALAWARPTAIPAIDRPGALPAGTGTMLLDVLARLAAAAGVAALRYAGPYPTAALWASLGHSLRADGDEATFTADAAARWHGGALAPIAIDFAPAPHERVARGPGVIAQLRDGLERVIIDGIGFERGAGVRRLVAVDDGWAAALWFGDRAWGEVGRFGVDGAVRARTQLPPADGDPAGQALPPALQAALLELCAAALPAPLTPAAVADVPIVWGDAGLAAAADRGDRIVLHVGLWHHLAPHGLARVALALAEALTPVAAARAVAALTR
ncbi:MAG: hypothetical protein IPL61_39980 [Myxococcales bacterium]|nr:hypothetical protein [Myxococcales bacterium]